MIEKIKWFFKIGWKLKSVSLANEWWAVRYEYENKKTGEIREVIEN